ncbi:mCG1038521 [Mus musculus]|nr:mCG1038521 [Mus musculus]
MSSLKPRRRKGDRHKDCGRQAPLLIEYVNADPWIHRAYSGCVYVGRCINK